MFRTDRRRLAWCFAATLATESAAVQAQVSPVQINSNSYVAPPPSVADEGRATPRHSIESWRQGLSLMRRRLPKLREIRAAGDRAVAQASAVLAAALPSVTANAALNHHLITGDGSLFDSNGQTVGQIPNPRTTWSAGATADIPLFAPKAWYDAKTANSTAELATLDGAAAERLAAINLADGILDVVLAERLETIARQSAESAAHTQALTERVHELGGSTIVDVMRVAQEAAAARTLHEAAEDTLLASREALGGDLGEQEPYTIGAGLRISVVEDIVASCPVKDLRSRADVRAAMAVVGIKQREVQSTDYLWLPKVDAVSTVTYWSAEKLTANGRPTTWTVGGVLSWQLYDGGLRSAFRRSAEAESAESSARLDAVIQQAALENIGVARALRLASARRKSAAEAFVLARQSAELTTKAFEAGQGTTFDVIETARRARDSELELARVENIELRAKARATLLLARCAQ